MKTEINTATVVAVIVTWNKKKDIMQLLEQLQDISYPQNRLEIVVVDNCSSDGTVPAIQSAFPQVRVLENSENFGGAGGFNAGMKWSLENCPDADYLWLLDNDVLVDENALNALVSVMEVRPDAAICGSRIMNRENRSELIEIGAFIDYSFGDIRRNMPGEKELENPDAVFEVDYVAACSLLARTSHVRKLGLWHEKFFIYWDDMEWGARFNAAGYKVLASKCSVVYHPSWAGRNADNSAIWRNYYRVRNALWFFSTYTQGLRRRLLISRMILRYMKFAAGACIRCQAELSKAFVRGIRDFFIDSYGKKRFDMPPDDLEAWLNHHHNTTVCVFIADYRIGAKAAAFISALKNKYPEIRLLAIVPEKERRRWQTLNPEAMRTYRRLKNGSISWADKYKIMKFMGTMDWDLLLTSREIPKMGIIMGKPVAKIDFETGKTLSTIENMSIKAIARIPLTTISFILRFGVRGKRSGVSFPLTPNL